MIFLLLFFTVSFVSASDKYVRLEDKTSDPGLPEHVTMDVVRNGRVVTRLNLQENKRLNENANVYESVYDNGKLRQTKRETKPMTGVKYYQDKRNGAALSVTCEETPTGHCKRAVEGYLDIGEDTFEIRPATHPADKRMTSNKRDNLHLISSVAQFKNSHERKRNTEQEYPKDYIETDKTMRTGKTNIKRQSETSKTEYAVEIIVVIDPYLWKRYLDKTEATNGITKEQATEYRLRRKFAHIINGVSLRYESIEDPAFNVYVTISGFQFYKTDDEKSPVPKEGNAPIFKEGEPYVDSISYVNNLMAWQSKLTGLQHDDHIMVFTGCELYSNGNISDTSVAGTAPMDGACSYARVSIQEEGSYYATTAVAAHELGHNLNASHDGSGTSKDCEAGDKYIMSPWVTQLLSSKNYTVNPWRFSPCSIASFRSYFQSEDGKCLTDHGDYYDKTEWDKHNKKLPGELHSLDQQCKLINGDYSGICSSGLRVTDERICRELECTSKHVPCSSHTPARGSPCGNPSEKKWCIDGKCVARVIGGTTAQPATTKSAPTSKVPEKPADYECFQTSNMYSGTRTVSKSGFTCVRWESTDFTDPSAFPDNSIADAANYCRDPDGTGQPWCFVDSNSTNWGVCDIPKCE
ncbi:A disintegrin and metalloproteinase with thrombospondin motifs adt-2-like isoform X2 [Mercenaria mercenaria]|uniref:A disintegrin and metalloproteinase with thrombospondin motifs adt-2-like isoform X2 n=1 Tax=Mercenaria mercenaria TaxID=6596 RepID=UPI00234E9D2E|nr:A disintegrin and metalloproteinase with thrombospondin motifs adt-2-like isoform X2 [Mercenaria mercenaria]